MFNVRGYINIYMYMVSLKVTAEKKEDNLPYQFFNMMIKTGTSSKLDSGIYTCFAIGDGEVGEAEVKLTIS